jgi:hypothetical protein
MPAMFAPTNARGSGFMLEIGGIRWLDQAHSAGSWSYNGDACELIGCGVDGDDKHPMVLEIKLSGGEKMLVFVDGNGEFPGLMYGAN